MKVVDTKGQQCPAPLIATRRALKESKPGESFKVLTDNKTSFENVSRFLKDNKTGFISEEKHGIWTLIITKSTLAEPIKNIEDYCTPDVPHFLQGDFVIAFASDKMGEGEQELGRLLITNFIKSIKDLDVLPRKMVFYNNGVKLGSTESPVYDHLKEIETMGVGLLFCATCVNFYKLQDRVTIGTLSNMFEIAQVMASADNVLKP
ncbi:MAG: sulfurtransferase-like selenium metabolism protein YedF [Bacteroidia bacterium]|nr:sulfurtransferase-like selenium metabolism protein YedF [Bacteroidia bacterium]